MYTEYSYIGKDHPIKFITNDEGNLMDNLEPLLKSILGYDDRYTLRMFPENEANDNNTIFNTDWVVDTPYGYMQVRHGRIDYVRDMGEGE